MNKGIIEDEDEAGEAPRRPATGDVRLGDAVADYLSQYDPHSTNWGKKKAAVDSLTRYVEGKGVFFVSQLTRALCSAHKHDLAHAVSKATGRVRSKVTQHDYTVVIKHFLRHLHETRQGLTADVYYSYKLARNVEASVYVATDAEFLLVLGAVDDFWDEEKNPGVKHLRPSLRKFHRVRMRALLATQVSTALRIGETLHLRLADYNREAAEFTARQTKTGTSRPVPVSPALAREIEQWLKVRPRKSPTDYLFVSETGGAWDVRACTRQYRRYLAWARARGVDLPRITMHSYRHKALTALVKENPRHAQILGGHGRITTTMRYDHTTTDDVRATHAKADALTRIMGQVKPQGRARGRKLA